VFSRVYEIGRRVRRWHSGEHGAALERGRLLEAERNFRRIAGYRAMPTLVGALHTHDAKIDSTSERSRPVACSPKDRQL
jgi:hypothetical protein